MEPVVPLPLDSSTLDSLTSSAKDWAVLNGVAFLTSARDDACDLYSFKRFALLPSPVPRFLFDQARAVQPDFNLLVHRVSQDREFLTRCLKSVVKVDTFTAGLFNIYEQVMEEGEAQPTRLGIYRSDYLLDSTNDNAVCDKSQKTSPGQLQLKQTEINTIAVTGAGFGEKIGHLHKALHQSVDGLLAAWEQYGSQKAMIVFVVEDERCGRVFNQRIVEFTITERNPSVVVRRYNLRQIEENSELKLDKTLFIAGYSPDHYPTSKEWNARLMIERSRAIKCPCISYHLAGTKKVQQELAQPGVLEKFLEDPMAVGRGLQGDKTVQMTTANPQDFVMKPQREGGGNNIFGEDIRTVLNELKDCEERSAYVVMDRIRPAVVPNYHIMSGQKPKLLQGSSELGIFGVFMAGVLGAIPLKRTIKHPNRLINKRMDDQTIVGSWCGCWEYYPPAQGDRVIHNKMTGHYMRTKESAATEKGIDTGWSVMDSPYLV
ncbi:hypothetical protein Bbelb_137740 [Branchiostoma belcheri]|nr:hypothetical protein Bbelb_137740 [Branchiostoma belcheri]